MRWKPINEIKKQKRFNYTFPGKKNKYAWKCEICNKIIDSSELHVDHIIPAGSLRNSDDLKGFVERLFCEIDGFQILCSSCNLNKGASSI